MSLYHELKRRNVFRVGIAYLALAWLLTEVSGTLFPAFGIPDWGVRFVVIVFALGFVPALIISWVYELTPEGIKREKDVVRDSSITHRTAKRLDVFTIGLIVVALVFILADRFWLGPGQVEQSAPESQYPSNSIAVLPFINMSDDAGNEYFSDGISEELLNLLAKIPELRVISRSSAFSFKGKNLDIPAVAARLKVAHVLEGSVRKAGNQVRITAQLIDTRTDTHLWSDTFDRKLDNIFAIQDEIAAEVVAQLKVTLLGTAPKVQETDPEAYALYLQARHLGRLGSAENYEQSNALYLRALAIEPDYAAAWHGLSRNYSHQAGFGLLTFSEGFSRARAAADKALAINPDYALAHASLGYIAYSLGDPALAARYYQRALQLDPGNINIIRHAANLLNSLGRLDEAIALRERANARDPVSSVGHLNLGVSYFQAGRWGPAIDSYETSLRLSPDSIGAHYYMGIALLFKGEAEASLAEMQQESFEAYRLLGLVPAWHALNDNEASDAVLNELIEKYEKEWAYNIAYVLAYRNEADRAFEWLDKAVEYGDPGLTEIAVEPLFSNIHNDPRWLPFLESIGRSPEQLAAIEFKVTLPK